LADLRSAPMFAGFALAARRCSTVGRTCRPSPLVGSPSPAGEHDRNRLVARRPEV